MSFAKHVADHRRAILFALAVLTLAGVYAAFVLPVGLFPQISFPRVRVNIDSGDRPAEQMALTVTKPMEEEMRRVPGVRDVRSISSRGSAEIFLNFDWGRDMVAATLETDAAVAQSLPTLPPGTTYTVHRMDPTTFPIIAYGLVSQSQPLPVLRDFVRFQIVPLLSTIPGVARVDIQGGGEREVQVMIDPARLATYGLALDDVAKAISAANVLSAVGHLEDHSKLYLLVADNSLKTLAEIRGVVVGSGPVGAVHVGDVADVVEGTTPEWIRVVEDGRNAVLFNVYEQPDGNAVEIAAAVRARLDEFKPHMPQGVVMKSWYDQSILVTQSAGSVRDAILIGLALAGLVLFAFLRSWRTTLIALMVVPAVLATLVLALTLMGQSFNIMTLGGIAAAIGLVIDDVIVMIEHIIRRAGAGEARDSSDHGILVSNQGVLVSDQGVLAAAREFLPPLTGSSLATVIVYLPLAFLTGVTGAFFKALSITMASALVISYVFTALAVPVLVEGIIDFRSWRDPAHGREGRLGRWHGGLLDRLIGRPWLILIVLLPVLALGGVAYTQVGTGFMPAMDEGGFIIDYLTAPGTSLPVTDREIGQIETILKSMKDVATFSRRTGLGLGGDINEPNQGDFFVRLTDGSRRPIKDVMADVRQRIDAEVPGITVELAQLMEDLIGDLTAVPEPIEIKLSAPNPADLLPAAKKVADAIGKISGVVEVKDGVVPAGDGLNLHVDAEKAALDGLDPDAVTRQVTAYVEGSVVTQLAESLRLVGVRVFTPPSERRHDSDLSNLMLRAPDGHLVPLGRVASVTAESGQPEIARENLARIVAVTGRIEGRDLGSTVNDVRAVLDDPKFLPNGVTYELGGLYQQQQIAFAGMVKVFIAALAAEFLLLLVLYRRFILAGIILATSLLSVTAVFTALWLTGIELNITAMMGMTMIIGIATEMAIFYISEFQELLPDRPVRAALRDASRNRLRPITMTTLAAILTLAPLALAFGEGSAMQQPLAVAIIAGLLLQFPMVLLVLPVVLGLVSSHLEPARS